MIFNGLPEEQVTLELFDARGRKQDTRKVYMRSGMVQLDYGGKIAPGAYILLISAGRRTWAHQIIISEG